MAMIGGQRAGGAGAIPANVMVEIARDPDRFEERVAAYVKARDEANEAQTAAREAQRELAADRQRFLDERDDAEQARREAEREIGEWRNKLAEHQRALNAQEQEIAEKRHALTRDQEALKREHANFDRHAKEQSERLARETVSLHQREQMLQQQGRQADEKLARAERREVRLREVERALQAYFSGEE